MARVIPLVILTTMLLVNPNTGNIISGVFHVPSRKKSMRRPLETLKLKKKKKWYHCFPAHAKIILDNGNTIPISKLRVGDVVRTSHSTTSEVYLFTHAEPSSENDFILIQTRYGNLSASSGHLVFANNHYMSAGSVQPGDLLETDSGVQSVVDRVSLITAQGLYHPQTLDGRIIVNGFVATTYTSHISLTIATPLLSPLRALFSIIKTDVTLGAFERDNRLRSSVISALAGVVS